MNQHLTFLKSGLNNNNFLIVEKLQCLNYNQNNTFNITYNGNKNSQIHGFK